MATRRTPGDGRSDRPRGSARPGAGNSSSRRTTRSSRTGSSRPGRTTRPAEPPQGATGTGKQDTTSPSAAPQGAASKNTASKGAASTSTGPKKTSRPTSTGSKKTGPKKTASRGADETRTQRAVGSRSGGATAPQPPRTRFTGRAAVLVLVVALLTVSFASSLRAYVQQRNHLNELKAQIAETEADINDLETEKRRWQDPAYVRAQARERFGFVLPGETGFQVLDENGEPLQTDARLSDPEDVIKVVPDPWWGKAWESVELAGNPPAPQPDPNTQIDGTKDQKK